MAISARRSTSAAHGRVEAAAVAHDDGSEERDQQQREGDGDRDGPVGAHLVAAQRGAMGERGGARGGRLAVDDVGEDAEDGIDGRVVEPQDALLVVLVDRVEERLAGAVVVGLEAQEACDGGARRPASRRAARTWSRSAISRRSAWRWANYDRVAALDPVLALDDFCSPTQWRASW